MRRADGVTDRRADGQAVRVVRDVLGLVLPQECPGCGRPDRALCRACLRRFGAPRRCDGLTTHLAPGAAAPLPTWALAGYADRARHVVLAWKGGGRPDLARPLADRMTAAASALAETVRELAGGADLVVVAAPSAASRRRSGRFVVGDLADAAGRGLADRSTGPVLVLDPLRRRRSSGHRLSAADRRLDRMDAVRCLGALPPSSRCVLVDDVVTTGATLAGCARALAAAGAPAVAALALAVTPPPGASPSPWWADETVRVPGVVV